MRVLPLVGHWARELYWDSPSLQGAYAAASGWAGRFAQIAGNRLEALDQYANAARRTLVPEVRARRLKAFADFVKQTFAVHPHSELHENVFVQDFVRSPRAEPFRKFIQGIRPQYRMSLGNVIVLKSPQGRERGVLLVRYEHFFHMFLLNFALEKVAPHFTVVLEVSWAPYPLPYWALFSSFACPSVCEVISGQAVQDMRSSGLPLVGIDLGSQDWVDPEIFRPLPGVSKDFDIVMIASFQRLKRHDLLFQTMQKLKPKRRLRAAIIGRTLERTREEFDALVRSCGVENDVTIFQGLKASEVNEVLNRSKVNLLLSKMEGGNKGLMEGMAANVPCVVYKHIVGPRHSDINAMTGMLAEDEELPEALLQMVENYETFRPREWFLAQTGYANSTRRLNALLREEALRRGEPWTTDIQPKVNRPFLKYVREEQAAEVQAGWRMLEDAWLR